MYGPGLPRNGLPCNYCMTDKIRRSWFLVPMSQPERIDSAHLAGADVVLLDLAELVAERDKPAARDNVQYALSRVRSGGSEAFAQVDPALLYADLRACVWPELTGVVVNRLESPDQICETARLLDELEEERGLVPCSLEIAASVETAKGNRNVHEIATASPRVTVLTLGRADLVMDLRPEPSGEIHLYQYLMQRLIIVANACGVTPIGAWWRAPDRGLLATPERTLEAATRGRAIGFKGSMCLLDAQVSSLNQGFTPFASEIEAAGKLTAAYQDRVGGPGPAMLANTMTVSGVEGFGDLILEPAAVDQARNLIDLAGRCAARDEAKDAALEQRPVPAP